jgi:hypothetical protein
VNLLESYLSPGDAKLLVEVYIGEESLRQRIAVTVKRRRDGDLVVGLGEIGFPRVTAGAQLAVARVALWIIGLHPDSALRGHNLRPAVWEDVAIAGGPPESQ